MNTINGAIKILTASLSIPWSGMWVLDVDIDPATPVIPTGVATALIGTTTLIGKVDDRASGKFGERYQARIVGGLGWHTIVPPQQWQNDAGVTLSAVLAVTGATVQETAVVAADDVLGTHYNRVRGVAGSVLYGRDWYVDLTGVTHVGPRLPKTLPSGAELLEWSPTEQRAILASDTVIEPGTVIVDTRLGSPATVRDAQCTIDEGRFRVEALCGPRQVSRLRDALERLAQGATKVAYAREYRYRVVADTGDALMVQAVGGAPDMPDSVQVKKWHGAHGVSEVATPGTEVVVSFLNGDPGQPVITSYDGKPVALTFDATTFVTVGTGAFPVAHAVETLSGLTTIATALTGVVSAASSLNASPGPAQKSDLVTLVASLATVQAAIVALAPTLPTKKLLAQ